MTRFDLRQLNDISILVIKNQNNLFPKYGPLKKFLRHH